MQITTLPVYSKLADPAEVATETKLAERLPPDWKLSQHQLETYRALGDPSVDVVINTAMTGDGKSLAGLLPLLVDPRHNGTLALFPTNELIQDQYSSAGQMLPQWTIKADRTAMLYGAQLDNLYADAETLQRPEVLLSILNNHRLVLSNPDMLHAMLQFHYQQYGRDPARIASQVATLFDQLTFDEFHIFDTPQVVSVLTGLLFLATQNPKLKTLFLSATPSQDVFALLKQAGFDTRLRMINPQREGWYHHGADPGMGWRSILQGSEITFVQGNAEDWLAEEGEKRLLAWFRLHRPSAKAALIVNSAATALRLVERLRAPLEAEGLTVMPNTGLTGRMMRKASYQADLLIGTSTVDVGVDFRINLLIFESTNAGTFLQRLGRLGRHTQFVDRNNQAQTFHDFAAYALVPPFIYERLTQPYEGQPPPLNAGEAITREQLAEIIRNVYPSAARFDHYTRFWGRFVPAKVYQTLSRKELRTTFGPVRDQLKQQYYDLTGTSVVKACREWDEYKKRDDGLLISEAQSFRGRSAFDCAVFNEEESEPFTYDLFWLLANARLELLSREEFSKAVVRKYGLDKDRPYVRGFQRFFFRWRGLRERREPLTVLLGPRVAAWGTDRQQNAQVLPGIRLDCAGHEFLTRLNMILIDEPCVGLIVPGYEPSQLQRACYLPPGMPLWPYHADSGEAGTQVGTIAFGRSALLLDSKLRVKPLGGTSEAPLIY